MAVKRAAQDTAEAVVSSARKTGSAVKTATGKAATATKETTKKAAKTAAKAVTKDEPLHYDAVVNKRGLSVAALTKTLNGRWEDGWRLAHVLEQRGNTVLVFERRGASG